MNAGLAELREFEGISQQEKIRDTKGQKKKKKGQVRFEIFSARFAIWFFHETEPLPDRCVATGLRLCMIEITINARPNIGYWIRCRQKNQRAALCIQCIWAAACVENVCEVLPAGMPITSGCHNHVAGWNKPTAHVHLKVNRFAKSYGPVMGLQHTSAEVHWSQILGNKACEIICLPVCPCSFPV